MLSPLEFQVYVMKKKKKLDTPEIIGYAGECSLMISTGGIPLHQPCIKRFEFQISSATLLVRTFHWSARHCAECQS
jgi:hypothetical protein